MKIMRFRELMQKDKIINVIETVDMTYRTEFNISLTENIKDFYCIMITLIMLKNFIMLF